LLGTVIITMRSKLNILIIPIIYLLSPAFAAAREGGQADAFSYHINTLVFAEARHPAHSTQNPDNAFLDLYRYSTELDVRPDLFYEQPGVSAVFKPRFIAAYQWWEDGAAKGRTDSPNRTFVNEWRVQAQPHAALFLSFGKEKLLWGPSFLASPSNVLFRDIEKLNPKSEVEGKYLAKMVYVPNTMVTLNAIAETQKEENERGETLKPLRLLKADLLGSDYLLSVIGCRRQDDRFRLGSFGQWTASDALVLYYDGIVTKGTDALYAVPDQAGPLGGAFVRKYEGSRLFTTVTAGGAYTFLSGSTTSLEFLYNGQGYNDAEAAEYYRIRQSASDHFFEGNALAGLSQATLGEALNNGLPFLRRYYLMGQYQVREIGNVLDVIVRYTHSLEEHTGQASSILEWRLSDRVQFFNINVVAVNGGRDSEFGSLLSGSFLAGIEAHF